MRVIGDWFEDRANARRLEKVLGYGGCRELWLQAELAMWLEQHGLLRASGNWDTNLPIPSYGKCDLATHHRSGGYNFALEIKVLGSTYQHKVLRGSGSLFRFVEDLEARKWLVSREDMSSARGFNLVSDYRRLRDLVDAREKMLLLVVVNRPGEESPLGKALTNIQFPATEHRFVPATKAVTARMWRL
jgi:hypothetical protein